jgi:hypothetical protein
VSRPAPVVGRIPAEIHLRAQRLGLIVETYTETIAGHGTTGRVTWAVSHLREDGLWADSIRLRYGTDSSHERARASLRDALDEIERSRA